MTESTGKRSSRPWLRKREVVRCAWVAVEHVSGGNVWLTFYDANDNVVRSMSVCAGKGS